MIFFGVLLISGECKYGDQYKPIPLNEMLDDFMSNTIFNRDHNTARDRAFLTQLFRKYTVLGEDAQGEINAKRVLTLFNARFCARELLREWRGLSGEALDAVVDSD